MSSGYLERVPLKALAEYLSVHMCEETIKARERTTGKRQDEIIVMLTKGHEQIVY